MKYRCPVYMFGSMPYRHRITTLRRSPAASELKRVDAGRFMSELKSDPPQREGWRGKLAATKPRRQTSDGRFRFGGGARRGRRGGLGRRTRCRGRLLRLLGCESVGGPRLVF